MHVVITNSEKKISCYVFINLSFSETALLLPLRRSAVSLPDQRRYWRNGTVDCLRVSSLLDIWAFFDLFMFEFVLFPWTEFIFWRFCPLVLRGFTDSSTAQLMLKRAEKMKSRKQQQKKFRGECVRNTFEMYALDLRSMALTRFSHFLILAVDRIKPMFRFYTWANVSCPSLGHQMLLWHKSIF